MPFIPTVQPRHFTKPIEHDNSRVRNLFRRESFHGLRGIHDHDAFDYRFLEKFELLGEIGNMLTRIGEASEMAQ